MEELPSLDDALESIAAPDSSEDALRSIVQRHRRRQIRALAGALLVVLVAGPALGWALGRSTESDGTREVQAATGQPAPVPVEVQAPVASASGMASMSDPGSYGFPPATRLFLRDTADGIRIRAYVSEFGLPPEIEGEGSATDKCMRPTQLFHAEISDDFVADNGIATVMSWTPDPAPVTLLDVGLLGVVEGSPILRVGLRTSPEVAAVRLRNGESTADQMVPVDGWAVLARHLDGSVDLFERPPEGLVEALDASGAVLGTVDLAPGPSPEMPPPACRPPMPPPPTGSVLMPPPVTAVSEASPARPVPAPVPASVP